MSFYPNKGSGGGGTATALQSATTVVNVSSATAPTNGQVLTATSGTTATWQTISGTGTVTSVSGSGWTTGLTLTGWPITGSGTLTIWGTLAIANGGTGGTTSTGTGALVLSTSPTISGATLTTSSINGVTPTTGGGTTTFLNANGTYTTPAGGGNMNTSIYDPAGIAQQVVGTTATQTIQHKTFDSTNTFPTLNQNTTGTASNVTGTVAVANGGTGSTTQNFVDLTTGQTIAGIKTFSSTIVGSVNGNAGTATTAGALSGQTAYSIAGNNTNASASSTALTSGINIGAVGLTTTNVLSSWSGSASTSYTQMNVQNTAAAGQSWYTATSADGSDTTHYVGLYMNNGTGPSITNAFFTNAHAASLYTIDSELDIGALGTSGAINFYSGQYASPNASIVGSTLSLGIGSSATAIQKFYNSSNANTVTLQSGATSTSYTMTLPTAVASAGQVLTDVAGNGVLSWTTSGGGSTPTFDTTQIWVPAFATTYVSATQVTFTSSGSTQAAIDANMLVGRVATWTVSSVRKYGYIQSASASSTTVTINVQGDSLTGIDSTTFRVTVPGIIVYEMDWYIPWVQAADGTNPVGKQWINDEWQGITILACDSFVGTAAVGTGAALTYNIYDAGSAIFSSAPSFGTNASVLNSVPSTRTIANGDRITLRTPSSAGATNVASDLNVIMYYTPTSIFSAF